MAIQIVQGTLDTDPLQDMGDVKYTKFNMTEKEANMASGMSISLGRIKPASEQIDNGEYRPDTHTNPISLFERRKKWKSEHRPSSQSSVTPPRPMTLTRRPNMIDETDMSSNVKVSGSVDEVRATTDTNISSNMRVLGSVDEMCATIDADASNKANVDGSTHTSGNTTACDGANTSGDENTFDDAASVKCAYTFKMIPMLQETNHDNLTSGNLKRCQKFDKLYTKTNDVRHLFNKYSLLSKHLVYLGGDVGDDYLLQCVPRELIHLIASNGVAVSGNTKKMIHSLDYRTRTLIWLSVTPTEAWEKYLSDVDHGFCNIYNSGDMGNLSRTMVFEKASPVSRNSIMKFLGLIVKIILSLFKSLFEWIRSLFSVRPQYLSGSIIFGCILIWVVTSLIINDGILQFIWKLPIGFYATAAGSACFRSWREGA